jgi:toxin ParE1/3/4
VTIRRTRQSELDLIEIWRFILQDSPEAADRVLSDIDDKCRLLSERPHIGRARTELGLEIRSFPYRRYLILYRIIDEGVEIIRVVHGARDLRDLLGGREDDSNDV